MYDVAVGQNARWKLEWAELLTSVRKERAERREEANEARKKKLQKSMGDVAYYYNVNRCKTVPGLHTLLRSKSSAGAKIGVLLEQTRHRLTGCAHDYAFETSLMSQLKGVVVKKLPALLAQLKQMIGVERAAATRAAFSKPATPPLPAAAYGLSKLPTLGDSTVKREEHETAAAASVAAMAATESHPRLLALEAEWTSPPVCFYDEDDGSGHSRMVRAIEWNKDESLWEALTERVRDDGSALPASKQLRPLPYGLWDDENDDDDDGGGDRWLPVFRDMVTAFEERKAATAAKKRGRGAAGGKKKQKA